ncbi:TRAP transporter large permease subunit [Ornithinibacillus sp. L9]|uniref:TRAP transporter large permease subunit n=1 Tax=Ornithinibacillus caprae TaxID=2678566 RepID=A0A6N8FEM6_9BACI|nr:TRAP transporter large permease [Ornithinibacillus caprae]MUK87641.1 TRAP transporter large permease subunit [Ornithinibacillus caprae]
MTMLIMLLVLIVALIIGIPAVFSMGIATLIYFLLERGLFDIPHYMVVQRTVFGLDSFTLLAIPLFLLVGKVMNESNVTTRLFDFAKALVGHFRGGLGQVNIAASVIFAGMSGSATADAAGLGSVEIKAMKDAKYPGKFAASITAASSLIGPIIPPSIPVVLYAIVSGVSVNKLLVAGIIPGLLMAISLSVFVAFQAMKNNYPTEAKASMSKLWYTAKRAFLPGLTPVILIGGILSGVFTATEAAAVGSLYAIILSTVVYRTISLRHMYDIFKRTMRDSAVIMIILAVANVFAWILTRERVPILFVDLITSFTENYYVVMGLCLIFLLILGMFLSSIVSITIATPVLVPLVLEVGGDPLHFGIIMIVALMIGEITPPFGMVLFAITRVGDIPFIDLVRGVVPYIIPVFILLIILIIFPALVTVLPTLFL